MTTFSGAFQGQIELEIKLIWFFLDVKEFLCNDKILG